MSTSFEGIYRSYNARFVAPRFVAKTFIPSDNYLRLLDADHSLVIGPRGSGKTSLLKMLQLDALRAWNHPMAEKVRSSIGFTGIFIPTDTVWKEQLDACSSYFDDPLVGESIVKSVISINILQAVIESFSESFNPDVEIDFGFVAASESTRRELCEVLASIWELDDVLAPTLINLKRSLRNKLVKITKFVEEMRVVRAKNAAEQFTQRGLHSADYITLASEGIRTFNEATGRSGNRWALCFDELELAPTFLKERLLTLLRSTDQELYFKLSMSPYSSSSFTTGAPTSAAEGDDYQVIALWYPEKEESTSFSEEMAKSLLERNGVENPDLDNIFGRSIVGSDSAEATLESPKGDRYEQMKQLAEKDPSFHEYLIKHDIKIERIPKLRESERASLVRKIYPVVVHRNFFLRDPKDKGGQRLKGRRTQRVYTGWHSLQALCEGNPRILLGLLNDMIKTAGPGASRIPANVQWSAIEAARGRLQAKLKTIKVTHSGYDKGLMKLIGVIGECFRRDLLGERFIAEPVASFDLDAASFDWLAEAIGAGLNAGALIYLPEDRSKNYIKTLAEKRFRINYLLATEYSIPLRQGEHRSVSFLIKRRDLERQIVINFSTDQ